MNLTSVHLFDPANYWFTLHSLAPGATAAAVFLLGVVVALRERHSKVSLAFLLLTLPVGIWFLGATLLYASRWPEVATRWGTVILIAVPLIGPGALNFASAVLGTYQSDRRRLAALWLVGATFSLLAIASTAVIGGVHRFAWGYYVAYSWLSVPMLAFTFGAVLLSLRNLCVAYRASGRHRQRKRSKWLAVAFAVGSVGVVDSLGGYGVAVYPFGFAGVAGFVGICAWTIWKYRLVDITPALAANNILGAMTDAVLVTDNDGYVQVANQAAYRLFRLPARPVAGTPLSALPGCAFAEQLNSLVGTESGRVVEADWGPSEAGDAALDISSSLLRDERGCVVGTVFIIRDVTDRKRAEQEIRLLNVELEERITERTTELAAANRELELEVQERRRVSDDLRRSRDQLDVILHGVADGIVVQDPAARVIFANAAGVQSLGIISLEALRDIPFDQVLHQFEFVTETGEICSRERLPAMRALQAEQVPDEVFCFRNRMTGHERWYILNATPVFDRHGQVQFAVSIFKEISERKRVERALLELSVRDELTGLYNRRELNRLLTDEVNRYRRYRRPAALVLVDIDHFKLVNDNFGHQAGDMVLRRVAELMQSQLRASDRVARFGGEEFAIVLPETTANEAYDVAEDLRQSLAALRCRYVSGDGTAVDLAVTVSLGVAGLLDDMGGVDEWVESADAALYFSKRTGRNKTTCAIAPEHGGAHTVSSQWATLVYDNAVPVAANGMHD
ncbi:MAG TPA: diguanylate cyclase [Chloroflexia bacterium]|nr:diguanylate cyclase [Chloroflexia bacterium]